MALLTKMSKNMRGHFVFFCLVLLAITIHNGVKCEEKKDSSVSATPVSDSDIKPVSNTTLASESGTKVASGPAASQDSIEVVPSTESATPSITPASKNSTNATPETETKAGEIQASTNTSQTDVTKSQVDAGTSQADAENSQVASGKTRTETKKVKLQIVKVAPAAEVTDLNDVDSAGVCAVTIKAFCSKVKPGNGSVADCLTQNMLASVMLGGRSKDAFTEDCKEEVLQFRIGQNLNINANPHLAEACMDDAVTYCNNTSSYHQGAVIACLREQKEYLKENCKSEVFKVQQAGALDFRADVQLYEACKADAERLCKHAEAGKGAIQACLRQKVHKLEWECRSEVYRQAAENAEDLRLNVHLFFKCLDAKKKFCPDVAPGHAQATSCLERHRLDDRFPTDCKEELDTMLQRRVEDFRLDPRIMRVCKDDMLELCTGYDVDVMLEYSDVESNCLQDSIKYIQDGACKKMISQYQILAAEDIRFNVPLAVACAADRKQFCGTIPAGSARVMRCLEKQRNKLSSTCRAELFDQEQMFSENIDFQYPLKKACKQEIESLCKDLPKGEARVIRCLQDKQLKDAKKFTDSCKKELSSYENYVSQDYRLSYKLQKACKDDVNNLCKGSCNATNGEVCGGRILHCLTEHAGDITNAACKKEVFYFKKMEVNDYKNDVILAEACKADVEQFCNSVESGEGRIHDCLREHRDKLSARCKEEELGLEAQEAENIELRPRLLTACKDERDLFCSGVASGNGRVFRCLAEHMGDGDFGESCAVEIFSKLSRRQANWKLDPSLRKACKTTVSDVCDAEDRNRGEHGEVMKCLIKHFVDLPDEGCQREVSRAMHMAFFIWQPESVLTKACDADVETLCLTPRPSMAKTAGAVLRCLSNTYKNQVDAMLTQDRKHTTTQVIGNLPKLSENCSLVIQSVEPHSAREEFETSLLVASIASSLQNLGDRANLKMVKYEINGQPLGFTLTGWTALMGVTAFSALLAYAAWVLYRRYYNIADGRDYTLVVKASPATMGSGFTKGKGGHR